MFGWGGFLSILADEKWVKIIRPINKLAEIIKK